MKKEIIVQLNKTFEESVYVENGIEYWMARDIQKLLDYTQWRNFLQVVDKAKTACLKAGQNISDHFADVSKMVQRQELGPRRAGEQAIFPLKIKGKKHMANAHFGRVFVSKDPCIALFNSYVINT